MENSAKNSTKYIIAGAGEDGEYLCKVIGENRIEFFVDGDNEKIGKIISGKEVISYKELVKNHNKSVVAISSTRYYEEIRNTLEHYKIYNIINGNELILEKILSSVGYKSGEKRIYLLNSHDGINVGDMLISIAELYFFRKYLPEYEVIEIPLSSCLRSIQLLIDMVERDDILVISGGGYMGTLWMDGGEDNIRKYIKSFPNNRIYIFPQTMYFEDNAKGQNEITKSKEIYNAHNNLTLCFRDLESYERGKKMFSDNILQYYLPDVVTLLDKSYDIYERRGITYCLRDDKEKVFESEQIKETIGYIYGDVSEERNISMMLDKRPLISDRMDVINNILTIIQKSEVVITDRLHCMLACAISGTPCIAFDNISHKVSGVYSWIKNNRYIYYCESVADALNNREKILSLKPGIYNRGIEIEKKYEQLANRIRIGSDMIGL